MCIQVVWNIEVAIGDSKDRESRSRKIVVIRRVKLRELATRIEEHRWVRTTSAKHYIQTITFVQPPP